MRDPRAWAGVSGDRLPWRTGRDPEPLGSELLPVGACVYGAGGGGRGDGPRAKEMGEEEPRSAPSINTVPEL